VASLQCHPHIHDCISSPLGLWPYTQHPLSSYIHRFPELCQHLQHPQCSWWIYCCSQCVSLSLLIFHCMCFTSLVMTTWSPMHCHNISHRWHWHFCPTFISITSNPLVQGEWCSSCLWNPGSCIVPPGHVSTSSTNMQSHLFTHWTILPYKHIIITFSLVCFFFCKLHYHWTLPQIPSLSTLSSCLTTSNLPRWCSTYRVSLIPLNLTSQMSGIIY